MANSVPKCQQELESAGPISVSFIDADIVTVYAKIFAIKIENKYRTLKIRWGISNSVPAPQTATA